MIELHGRGVSNGIAIGTLDYFKSPTENVPKYIIDSPEKELERYHNALKQVKLHFDRLCKEASNRMSKSESAIFQMHLMILEDAKFVENVEEIITERKMNAEFGVSYTSKKLAAIFRDIGDEYLQSRYADVLDAANTLIKILLDGNGVKEKKRGEPVIIAADELMPSETISLKKEDLLGFATNSGSQSSHTAILARTMGLPYVTQIKEPLSQYNGKTAIIDGQLGKLFVDPDDTTLALYHAKKERYNKQQELLKKQIGLPSVTRNGQKVVLSANIGSLDDISSARNNDTEGIGMFRSEYLFMHRSKCPSEEEQLEAYKRVIRSFRNSEVVIRTADLGVDRGISYLDIPEEKNPAIGFKGIRVSLANHDFFRTQLRALYRASVYGRLRILFPMVNSMNELDYVKRIINGIKAELRAEGKQYNDNVQIGVLVETPAAALISDEIAEAVDFISIGTNGLTEYTLALDNNNRKLEYFYEPYHKGIMRLINYAANNAHKKDKRVMLCGELASDTTMTSTFLAMKIDELVMAPSKILKVRAKVRDTDTTYTKDILAKYI